MKQQYAGDVSDYRKYALLRKLSGVGRLKVGVCWMLTPPDARTDGNKIKYLDQPGQWRPYDPPLFDLLASVVSAGGDQRLSEIESSGILPSAIYVNETVPDEGLGRTRYFERALSRLKDSDIVFFDPDNGIEIASRPKGRVGSSKFVFLDEIAATFAVGHSVLIYQHFTRVSRGDFIRNQSARLEQISGAGSVSIFETPHAAFLLLGQQTHCDQIDLAIQAIALWKAGFIGPRRGPGPMSRPV